MSRGRWLLIAGAALLALTIFVLVWFQPQKLFIDERVDEDLPVAVAPAPSPSTDPATGTTESSTLSPPADAVLRAGTFISRDHTTTGTVKVVELADGRRFIRLEDLATDNGPDLYVYLSATTANGPEGQFDDAFVSLGRLKANLGNQNYEIPPEVSLDEWASVVIWCDRFNSAFGAAELESA